MGRAAVTASVRHKPWDAVRLFKRCRAIIWKLRTRDKAAGARPGPRAPHPQPTVDPRAQLRGPRAGARGSPWRSVRRLRGPGR